MSVCQIVENRGAVKIKRGKCQSKDAIQKEIANLLFFQTVGHPVCQFLFNIYFVLINEGFDLRWFK